MNDETRTQIVRTIGEIGPGPFSFLFIWSLFDLKPSTVPQLERITRSIYSRPTLRTYLRKLENLGIVNPARDVWVPTQIGKNIFSLNSINLIESVNQNGESNNNNSGENVFPGPARSAAPVPAPSAAAPVPVQDPDVAVVLSAFGVVGPKRSQIAASGISARDVLFMGFNLMDECSNSPRLRFAPGLLIWNLDNRRPGDGPVELRSNPYRFIHREYCTCSACSPLISTGDPIPAKHDPTSPEFDPIDFVRNVWKPGVE